MTQTNGVAGMHGDLSFQRVDNRGRIEPIGPRSSTLRRQLAASALPVLTLRHVLTHGLPRRGLAAEVNEWRTRNFPNLWRSLWRPALARRLGVPHFHGALYLAKIGRDGERIDYGLAGLRMVTTAGVNYLVDSLQGTVEPELFHFHGVGTGTNAEATTDTALQTELTVEYNPNNTRATGSLTEGATANVFRTVGTNAFDAVVAITEHGLFSQAAVAGGTLLDRTVFAVQNFVSGESQQATYDLTFVPGS